MIRAALAALLVIYSTTLLAAPPDVIDTVVAGRQRPSKNLLLVVDTSGSMEGDAFSKALGVVEMIAKQPLDAGQVGVIGFTKTPDRWTVPKSMRGRGGKGWASLPSSDVLRAALAWLKKRGAVGWTKVVPALTAALRDPQDPLTIVLVTDGDFWESREWVMSAWTQGQAARRKRGLRPALLMAVGVSSYSGTSHLSTKSVMAQLGKAGRGGFYISRPAQSQR